MADPQRGYKSAVANTQRRWDAVAPQPRGVGQQRLVNEWATGWNELSPLSMVRAARAACECALRALRYALALRAPHECGARLPTLPAPHRHAGRVQQRRRPHGASHRGRGGVDELC